MGRDVLKELVNVKKERDVLDRLKKLSDDGMVITVEGYLFSLEETAKVLTLSEGVCYMPDYLKNEQGKPEIRFIKVYLTNGDKLD
ncbi:MAG: hypothetical protein IKR47_01710 [Lachnospiraceae bacterium]|nr:hypothetical protein [Lachnospiraceae bacterium]MCR4684424.1 hypothetical protein [Lachnospiraceae bacterium]